MTPEQAESIYYEAYSKARHEHEEGVKPLDQRELRMKSWQAVIDAIKSESDTEWAKRYLSIQETSKH